MFLTEAPTEQPPFSDAILLVAKEGPRGLRLQPDLQATEIDCTIASASAHVCVFCACVRLCGVQAYQDDTAHVPTSPSNRNKLQLSVKYDSALIKNNNKLNSDGRPTPQGKIQ